MTRSFLVIGMLCMQLLVVAQAKKQSNDTAYVNHLIDSSKQFVNTDPAKALSLSDQARELATKINFPKGEAYALKNLGLVYYFQGKYVQTLDYWKQSLKILQAINDDNGVANLLGNIGAVYANQGDDVNALNHHLQSLKIAEKTGDKVRTFFALNNIGGIYFQKKQTWDKALDYLLKAYPLAEETGNKEGGGLILGNIGEIYYEKKDYPKAILYYNKALQMSSQENTPFAYNGLGKVYLKQGKVAQAQAYHKKALDLAQKLNEIHIVPSLLGMAETFRLQNDNNSAFTYYKQAEDVALKQKSFPDLKDLYNDMAKAYSNTGDYANAFAYQKKLADVKDTLFNEATQKKLGLLQFEFDLEKKQGEINLLTKDNALREQQLQQQRFVKNAYGMGLVLVFILAFVLFRSYRNKVKTNKILDQQKEEIENLLLNILPLQVALELQTTGNATPKSYDRVAVMFTDFKDFTSVADKLSPEELVKELNICFVAFDEIIEKHGLEKIKTIGDSYMCAGGIPAVNISGPYRIVRAALDIQAFMKQYNGERKEQGLEPLEMRIGIHVGPVVAGVVGKKKYAYDIWGSTVNIASRMESYGEPGKINVSAATYELIKDKFVCNYRGKLYAKNVGEIDMYFVQEEIATSESQIEMAKPIESLDKAVYADPN